jgi:thiamine biosynthesis lipoprotein ApbE
MMMARSNPSSLCPVIIQYFPHWEARLRYLTIPLFALLLATHIHAEEFIFHHENVLSTSAELRIHADSRSIAVAAEEQVLAHIDRLAHIVSTYDLQSEVVTWMAGDRTAMSPELYELLLLSDQYEQQTDGAFNPRVGAVMTLWKKAAAEGKLPDDDRLRNAVQRASRPVWRLNTANQNALLLDRGTTALTFDAIAKGFIIDKATEAALKLHGVSAVVINIGGDLRVAGTTPQQVTVSWPTDESKSIAVIDLSEKAIATSGGYQRFFEIDGRRYSHIIDPRTGRPVDHSASVSVIANTAAAADAAATALSVMTVEEALSWCNAREGFACLILDSVGKRHRSRYWPSEKTHPEGVLLTSMKSDEWPQGAKLTVSYEINNPGTTRYRRPYVAVWVEDADGFPVRTLVLWLQEGRGARWHRDLTRWYKQDQVRRLVDGTKLIGAVSAATRPPGKYKVVWDGKDDHGNFVPQGTYTLYIEAAREHGSHQLASETITIGPKSQQGSLKGNTEIKSVEFEYKP